MWCVQVEVESCRRLLIDESDSRARAEARVIEVRINVKLSGHFVVLINSCV